MARRKRQFMDDGDSSGDSDSDGGFDDEDSYQSKRRKMNGEETEQRSDWTKAPAFVSGHEDKSVEINEGMGDNGGEEEEEEEEEGENMEESDEDDDSDAANEEDLDDSQEPSRVPSPRIREEEDEDLPPPARFGGIGSGASPMDSFSAFKKGGIGSSKPVPESHSPSPAPESFPSAFGAARAQRSFVRSDSPASKPATPLPAHERAHFSKLSGFGAKMMEKMGWQAGMGLGTTGEGIVIPVESKLRPKNMGIAFKGFKEKTEQSKLEAKRRGEVVSDDEDDVKPKKGGKKAAKEPRRSDAWKKPKKVKTKVEHKTYEQIVAEAGQDAAPAGIGMIIDATGATPREIASLADVSSASWTPSTDPERIPEVRHNLRLISDACKSDLDGLAREAKALEERKRWLVNEDLRLRKKVEEEAELISRMQQINLVVDDINVQAKDLASVYEVSLDPFSPHFSRLLIQFPSEFDRYRLDEIVVAAIAPLVRRLVAQWNPLEEPIAFISTFRTWRRALKLGDVDEKPQTQVDVYGTKTFVSPSSQVEKPMTPFESLLWNVWLPKVRSCLNNDWSPQEPQPAVRLYEAWSTFLPPFIRDNVLDQLILPKVHEAVSGWNPRKDTVPLQSLVFPWLPHLGLRLEDVLGDARRKVKSLLRGWSAEEGVPKDFAVWKDVFNAGDWDAMLLKYIVPKLGAILRNDFRIDPRKQNMEPLQQVLSWSTIIRPSIFSQLIETEFFPKWLDILHIWLIQPKVSFEEVAQWYQFWKESFPENVQTMSGVSHGFTRGLQLMNKAIELGPDAPSRLPRPDHLAEQQTPASPRRNGTPTPKVRATRIQEVTFRSVVEDFAASHNLLFIPTGRAHEKSRMPLFRVSQTADGKGGLLVYILDDAIWAPDGEEYRAITPQDMVLRASK